MNAYREEIVWTPSEDQRAQAGALIRPTPGPTRPVGVVCIHGANNLFYMPLLLRLGRALAQRGYLFVSGNTRGHDVAALDIPWSFFMPDMPDMPGVGELADDDIRLGGGGWARWDEEPHDVAGWINCIAAQGVEQGVTQVVLLGHSLGVRRILSYQALRQDPRVVGLMLLSGTDRVSAVDPSRLALAEHLVAEGREDAPLPLVEGMPLGFALESAGHLVHWERHVSRVAADGHTPWIANIRTPMLAAGGTADAAVPNLRADLEDMRARAAQAPGFDIHMVEGADHFYLGHEGTLATVLADWLDALLPASQEAR